MQHSLQKETIMQKDRRNVDNNWKMIHWE